MIRSVSNHQKAITTLAFNVRSQHLGRNFCMSSSGQSIQTSSGGNMLKAYGSRLISGSLDQHLKIYNIVDYTVVHTIKYNAPILCSALSV